jgi:alkylation response protein AidB-like acyl-CoA dehydrogenase
MQFSFTEEQEAFRDVLRRFLEDRSPTGEVRRLMETSTGYDAAVWRQMCQDLGLTAVHIPERYGGQGFGFVELGIVLEEMGRVLLCAPYFSTAVLATAAILNGGSEDQKHALLPGIASGETLATFAFTEDGGRWDGEGVTLTAVPSAGGYRLQGHKSFVLDGHTADLIVVLARRPGTHGEEGLSLFTVSGDAAGLDRRVLHTLDPTRKQARLVFDDVQATLLGEEGGAAGPFARTFDQALACLASEMAGGADRLREMALDYSLLRVQFGRAIGSFQAIKHKCADLLLDVELAKSAAYYAAAAAAEDADELPAAASLAKAAMAEAYMRSAIDSTQIHGGIGFTWDNDTHLWFKRAKSSEVLLGAPDFHRERMLRNWDLMERSAA